MKREGFIFYRSFIEAIDGLSKGDRNDAIYSICKYGIDGIVVEDVSPVAIAIFKMAKPQIDANNQRFNNGKNGGRPKKEKTKIKPNNNQIITEPKAKEKEKEKEKENVKDKDKQKEDILNIDNVKFLVLSGWRNNYENYLEGLRQCYSALQRNQEWIREREKFNPNVDVKLSMEKACKEYWATEAGWKKKKSSKTSSINWKSTMENAITLNKVYKQKNNNSSTVEL